jgi:2-C-methyl-D-erythritol 2,4-cyclodiphosphate synthase
MDNLRVGIGYDSHRLVEGRRLVLGGFEIPYERGLLGHSDADVLTHALMDSLLGAAGLGDVGEYFPDSDEKYRDADSVQLLGQVFSFLEKDGYAPVNADITLVVEQPMMRPYIGHMIENLEEAGMPEGSVNIKATRGEGMGFVGRGEGIACISVAMVKRVDRE